MKYPENERILIVRPCLKTICLGVKPAAKLLSALLYQARNCSDEQIDFTIQWTQEQVIRAVCEEFTSKTLHDTAIPCLELLGYLDVDTSSYVYQYIIHLDLIRRALEVYSTPLELELLLIACIRSQLEEVLNELEKLPNQLEEVLNELEKLLIVIRKTSNSKRGRRTRAQATLGAVSEDPRLLEIDKSTKIEEESVDEHEQSIPSPIASALSLDAASPSSLSSENETQYHKVDSTTQEGDTAHAQPVPLLCPPSLPDRSEPAPATGATQVAGLGPPGLLDGLPVAGALALAEGSVPVGGRAEHDTEGPGGGGDEQQSVEHAIDGARADHAPVASLRLTSSPLPPVASEGRRVIVVGSLTVTPIAVEGATVPVEVSHEQDRDTSPKAGTVEDGSGHSPLPGATSPQMRVLIAKQQFASVDEWKAAQETFVETLRGVWKGSNAADKKRYGNWNVYRKQHLERWQQVNPDPSIVRFTDDGRALFDEWCSLFKASVDAGKANIEAANWLAPRLAIWAGLLGMTRVETMRNEKDWCYANDKNGYYKRGVKLFDLKRDFEGWQSYQQSLLDKRERDKPSRTLTKDELRRMPV